MRTTASSLFWHFGSRGARPPVSSVIPVVLPSPPPTIAIVPKVLIAHKLENSRSDPNVVNTRVMVMRTRGRMPRLFPDLLCDPPGLTVFPSDPAVR
jgi:hypothetical protein